MFEATGFGKNMAIMHRAMDVGVLRYNVISDNLANADTPNFKRTDVTFESQLKRALDSETKRVPEGALTHSRHIPFNRSLDWRQVQPRRQLDFLSTTDNNGNNVNAEAETMAALQTQMTYSLLSSAMSTQFNQISLVVR